MERLSIKEIVDINNLEKIEQGFLKTLSIKDRDLLHHYRKSQEQQDEVFERIGLFLERYLIDLFEIEKPYRRLQKHLEGFDGLAYFFETVSKPSILRIRFEQEKRDILDVKKMAEQYQDDERLCIEKLLDSFDVPVLSSWVQAVWVDQEKPYIDWQVFALPKRIDFDQLVQVKTMAVRSDYRFVGPTLAQKEVMHHINYCIECHHKGNDTCSKGFWKKGEYKISPLQKELKGCPLGQKISQMHGLRKKHQLIAALATIMVDNPMCLVTGDRICNDCMLSCIYQKVDPVDTPSVESDTVRQILSLPYGAEIYLLLTKWNPLKHTHYMYNPGFLGNVAVVGMGPSGFAMSYYLLLMGAQVLGLDGLPIMCFEKDVSTPIKDFDLFSKSFNKGLPLGFGGVIDYGITVRWDKRLILLIWVLLHRFPRFSVMGNVRLGGAVTIDRLKKLGFDQVVLATGAGLPKAHRIQNKQGIYFANEFLMQLHLSGMMEKELRRGLQLPIAIIGGGLTATDAATEAQVYYIRFVKQVAFWFDTVDEEKLLSGFSQADIKTILTWRMHGEALRGEKDLEKQVKMIQDFGGVHIVYRRSMQESNAYRTNYVELLKALEQGVVFHEHMDPLSVETEGNRVNLLVCQRKGEIEKIPAKTIFIATGTKPNVAYYYENREDLLLEDGYYQRSDKFVAKSNRFQDYVSIVGDLHPEYHGSVVGALASSKDSYQGVVDRLRQSDKIDMQAVMSSLQIQVKDLSVFSKDILEIKLESKVDLPIGSYLKITVLDQGVVVQLKAVMVDTLVAWVDRRIQPADLLLTEKIQGVLGPSGTRIIGKDCSDEVVVISDLANQIWAMALLSAITKQGKQAILFGQVGEKIANQFSKRYPLDQLSSDESRDCFYCLSSDSLKALHQKKYIFKQSFAVVDGPMMCMLKGVCGQCIQWQLSEKGPLKAVYSCSWQAQPIELIDIEHYSSREQVEIVDNTLYKRWRMVIDRKG